MVRLALKPAPDRWRAAGVVLAARLKELYRRRDPEAGPVQQAQLAWARAWRAWVRAGSRRAAAVPMEVQAIAVGDLALVGLAGEIFARYQLELENTSPVVHTVLCGYANGCVGYVPTADEHRRGGYEIEQAHKVYPSVQGVAPECEAQVRAAAFAVLGAVGGQ